MSSDNQINTIANLIEYTYNSKSTTLNLSSSIAYGKRNAPSTIGNTNVIMATFFKLTRGLRLNTKTEGMSNNAYINLRSIPKISKKPEIIILQNRYILYNVYINTVQHHMRSRRGGSKRMIIYLSMDDNDYESTSHELKVAEIIARDRKVLVLTDRNLNYTSRNMTVMSFPVNKGILRRWDGAIRRNLTSEVHTHHVIQCIEEFQPNPRLKLPIPA